MGNAFSEYSLVSICTTCCSSLSSIILVFLFMYFVIHNLFTTQRYAIGEAGKIGYQIASNPDSVREIANVAKTAAMGAKFM